MRTLFLLLLVAISISIPVKLMGGAPERPLVRNAMPPAVLAQVTNAGPGPCELRIDGVYAGVVSPREVVIVNVFPGYRFLEWKWLQTGERGSARVEVPNEPAWQYTIR
ncbi:MAG: hypothetical protein U1A77_16925 [Pirellulales bacterium]